MDIQWPLVFFTVLGGAGGWLIAIAAANEFLGKSDSAKVRKLSLIIGMVLVIMAGCASALHLTHPDRMMAALGHPTSGIFTEALLTGLIVLASIIYLVLIKRDASKTSLKVIAVVAGILGLVLPFATGMSYMMSSKPAWDTILFPLACFGTTATTGFTTYLVIQFAADDAEAARKWTCTATVVAGIAAALLSVVYAFSIGAATGAQAGLFWGGVIAVGCALPTVCAFLAGKGRSGFALAIAALAGAYAGSFVFRCFMWLIGTTILTLIGNGNWFGSV